MAVAINVAPGRALAGALALALAVAVFVRPVVGAYALLFFTPLIAGIDRGELLPAMRPNEALLGLVLVVLALRGVVRVLAGDSIRPKILMLDVAVLALAITSSVFPILWMVIRQRDVTTDDVLYALALWKYLALYIVVRSAARTERDVRHCLWVSLAAAAIVAVLGILQSLQVFGVPALLGRFYAPFGSEEALTLNRGTSTLASSFAMADVMAFHVGIVAAWLTRHGRPRQVLAALGVLFVVGAVASGQFSGVIALVVTLVIIGLVTGRLARGALVLSPVFVATAALLQPVLQRRLAAISSETGLPSSWLARIENLRRFFWPELFRDFNWIVGVRPSARVAAPEHWREWVWIESGHTWLLWNGGIALLVAFFAFLITGWRLAFAVLRRMDDDDVGGVVAIAVIAALSVLGVLMTFDPHLTLRGAADLLFALLGLLAASSYRDSAVRAGTSREVAAPLPTLSARYS